MRRARSARSTSPIHGPPRWRRSPPRSACPKIRLPGRRHFSSPSTATLHEQPQPPSSTRFVPALHPPDEPPSAALWFAFSGDRLLVHPDGDTAALPDYSELAELGVDFDDGHYLGRLDDIDCYTVSIEQPPEGEATLEGLRALYGRLSDDLYAIPGRAVQILLWDKTHRFCGRCGQPTVNAPAERAKLCPQCGLLSLARS